MVAHLQAQQPPAPGKPDYRLSASPDALVVHRGQTGTVTIKVEPLNGFKGRVELLSSLLYATTTTFSPTAITDGSGTSVLSISPADAAITGKYLVSVTATNDGISHSITIALTVK